MQKITITGNSSAADTDGYANDVTASSGVALALAATVPGDGLAHKAIITPSGSVTGNYAITGTDADGNVQTETLATNTTNAVTSAKYFASLTSVLAPSGIGAATVDIGWTAASASAWAYIAHRMGAWPAAGIGFACVKDSGTPTYTVQQQYGDGVAFAHATAVSKSDSFEGAYATSVAAIRLSWAAAGEVSLHGWY